MRWFRDTNERIAAKVNSIWEYFGFRIRTTVWGVARWECIGFAFTSMQIGEWLAAIALWVTMAAIGIGIGIASRIKRDKSSFGLVASTVGWVALGILLVTVTVERKPENEPWSNLQKLWSHNTHPAQQLEAVSLYMECRPTMYPVTILAGLTLHVIRIHPAFLVNPSKFRGSGIILDVAAPNDKNRTWPSTSEGRMLTWDEIKQADKAVETYTGGLIYECKLSNNGKSSLEDIYIRMSINGMDNKRYIYSIPFDPLIPAIPFKFSVVNMCSTMERADWSPTATVHVLGEQSSRNVPLQIIKRDWPGDLMAFSATIFKWSGVGVCEWSK